ncbi:competence protein ComE [Bacillus clarus]|uniref:ComE operon protein 1 n=1 Tax=Bacillus clarus TaxID=2338372 RepID=A0A090ZA41_9BACI|nr:helix-hairpin-helix domain-containing protein [Bacillus clarus]KFN01196.1 comE operon protein 1 [Bacillus clarus]RFT67360.1 competence protein ComE [Bacillus clarus]
MMWNFQKKWIALLCAIGVIALIFFWQTRQKSEQLAIQTDVYTKNDEKKSKLKVTDAKEEKKVIMIDIKGAVHREGVYEMKEGDRVKDGIEKAGGFLLEADVMKVNLAQIVQDQMLLHVPRKGEDGEKVDGLSKQDGKVRINAASKEQIEKITGIGSKKAESIMKYREEHGPFQKMEDLLEIDGIGVKSLEKIKEQIIIP